MRDKGELHHWCLDCVAEADPDEEGRCPAGHDNWVTCDACWNKALYAGSDTNGHEFWCVECPQPYGWVQPL